MQTASTKQNSRHELFGWWYRFAAPPEVSDDASLRERENVRKGKVTSLVLLAEIISTVVVAIGGLASNPGLLIPLSISMIILIISAVLNRFGKTLAAGIIVIVVVEGGMLLNMLALSQPNGISPFNLSLLDILVEPELIAVSLFPAWVVFPVALTNCLLIAAAITFLPKTPETAHLIETAAFNIYYKPIGIQLIAAFISYIWVSNAMQAMKRAASAEEVNKLTQALAIQQKSVLNEKRKLEESIQQIVETHTKIANGDFTARVPLNQSNVLWSIAGSLNNLLARLQSWRKDSTQLQRTEQAIQQAVYNIHLAQKQGIPFQAMRTGTALDPLLAEIVSEKGSQYEARLDQPYDTSNASQQEF